MYREYQRIISQQAILHIALYKTKPTANTAVSAKSTSVAERVNLEHRDDFDEQDFREVFATTSAPENRKTLDVSQTCPLISTALQPKNKDERNVFQRWKGGKGWKNERQSLQAHRVGYRMPDAVCRTDLTLDIHVVKIVMNHS